MEKLEWILSMAGTALGLLATTVTFLTKFIKSAKAKKAAEQIIKISEAILPYIEQAEQFTHYSGDEKKEYVMTKANQLAIEKGYDFNAAEVSAKIEGLVALTKHINARDKDKYAEIQPPPHGQALPRGQ